MERRRGIRVERSVRILPMALAAVSVVWAPTGRSVTSPLDVAGYCVILVAAVRWRDFGAPMIGGRIGIALRLVELFRKRKGAGLGDGVFLVANVGLSAALVAWCVWAPHSAAIRQARESG